MSSRPGPCASLINELLEQEDFLQQGFGELPCGLDHDSRAEPSEATFTDLAQARDLLKAANTLLDGVIEREAMYSVNNGWTLPEDTPRHMH